jgi:hypothetical protein
VYQQHRKKRFPRNLVKKVVPKTEPQVIGTYVDLLGKDAFAEKAVAHSIRSGLSEEKALKVYVDSVEGDVSQLPAKLVIYAKEKGWIDYSKLNMAAFGLLFRNWLGTTPEGFNFDMKDLINYYAIYKKDGLPPFNEWINKMADGKTAEEFFAPLRPKPNTKFIHPRLTKRQKKQLFIEEEGDELRRENAPRPSGD